MEKIRRQKQDATTLAKECEEIFFAKKSLNKEDKARILSLLRDMGAASTNNMSFFAKQWDEEMERTITEAKGEIEAFWENKVNAIARSAIAEKISETGQLDAPVLIESVNMKNDK